MPPKAPWPGIESTTYVCAPAGNWTRKLLVYGTTLQPTEQHGQGFTKVFKGKNALEIFQKSLFWTEELLQVLVSKTEQSLPNESGWCTDNLADLGSATSQLCDFRKETACLYSSFLIYT